MSNPSSSSLRATSEWKVCRHLIRLLMELDNHTIDVFDDEGRLGFWTASSHDQHALSFLTEFGVLEGGWVRWKLVEPDFDRCADILLESAPFDRVLDALVSTTVYNGLFSETRDAFELPFGQPFGEPVIGPILDNLKTLMSELVALGYARRVDGPGLDAELYSWTERIAPVMVANHMDWWSTS
jgi:hypothetical protein